MALSSGTCLGPYEILAAIGAGGMGEVYRALDTRLDRTVAIKILSPEVSADPDRRARFEREARTIGALSHPHICTLHDVGEQPSTGSGPATLYLVMEHLAGETLAARLAKGPLPLEQAMTVATQMADALATAHRQGVVDRDLKPGNVMLTKAGVKLLDFGLAKLTSHGEQPAAAHLASEPTRSAPLTGEGVILGTLVAAFVGLWAGAAHARVRRAQRHARVRRAQRHRWRLAGNRWLRITGIPLTSWPAGG
jgi:serine/threonine protein kinase